jgi:hypothetical protein
MNRLNQLDVVIELGELCRDLVSEIRYQLNYYRASVYKSETAKHISYRVEKLRLVAKLMMDDTLLDAFQDHDAERELGPQACVSGECSFSSRTTRLLATIEKHAEILIDQANHRQLKYVSKDFGRNLLWYRRELLALCKQGSRQWAFFQGIESIGGLAIVGLGSLWSIFSFRRFPCLVVLVRISSMNTR